jgi:hypothetical protein
MLLITCDGSSYGVPGATAGRAPRLLGAAPGRLAAQVWTIRLLIAAAAAVGQCSSPARFLSVAGAYARSASRCSSHGPLLVLLPWLKQRL